MEVILFLVAWVLFAEIVGVVLPVLIVLLGQAVQLLCLCVWVILRVLGLTMARLAMHGLRATRWTCRQGWLFLIILLDEWSHGPRTEEAEEKLFENEEGEGNQRQGAYDAALALLSLKEPFALTDLKRVYRQAMKAAHTDVGGTKETAAALNTARDLVMEVRGWK